MLLEQRYVLELIVEQRLADLREYAMERAVLRSMRSRRRPLRALLGMTLVRLGRWLTGLRRRPAVPSSTSLLCVARQVELDRGRSLEDLASAHRFCRSG